MLQDRGTKGVPLYNWATEQIHMGTNGYDVTSVWENHSVV